MGMGPMYPLGNFPTLHMPFIHQEVDDDFHPEKVHLCKLTGNKESPQILIVSNQIWCTISVFSDYKLNMKIKIFQHPFMLFANFWKVIQNVVIIIF